MTASLPRHPSIEFLKKQAKQLLAAQRHGMVQCCPFMRRLHRFAKSTDEEILAAHVTLAEVQLIVAMHYGFTSWAKLRDEVRSVPVASANSLDAVVGRSTEDIPDYAGAGVPLGIVAALNHAGVDIEFMEFAAASGWAFSFGYKYDDISPAHMAVRGNPQSDGPFEVFAFLPQQYGFDYEMARTAEPDELWFFVKEHVDAGTPIMSEHMDGGLISDYREQDGLRQIFFDGTVVPGWTDADKLHPFAVYALIRNREAHPSDEIRRRAIRRAAKKGAPHSWEGTPQGLAALQEYLADVSDPAKDFVNTEEWFCWAAFERLMARRCCAVWLRATAEHMDGAVKEPLLEAARGYGEAFQHYDRYRAELAGGVPATLSLVDRARTPERIAVLAELLEQGITAESAGLDALTQAAAALQ
jgi:hypothetical protein